MVSPVPTPATVTSPLPESRTDAGIFRHAHGQVQPAVLVTVTLDQHRAAAYGQVRRFGREDLLRVAIGAGVGYFVRLYFHRLPVAGGNAHIAARVLDVDG